MSSSYLTLTNNVLGRLNEVQLTASNFDSARGIQTQTKEAINQSIRFINQKEFAFPFNHATETKTLTAGKLRLYACIIDTNGEHKQLADEVDRDQLA